MKQDQTGERRIGKFYCSRVHAQARDHMGFVPMDPAQFARIHRSTLVNLDCVKELLPHFNEHLVILRDGTELKLSRTRKEWLEQWLGRGVV